MHNIVFTGDDKYIKYIAVAITSIVKSTNKSKKITDFQQAINKEIHGESFVSSENLENEEEGYFFHVLADFISEDTKIKLKGLEQELDKIFPTKIDSYEIPDTEFRGFPTWRKSYLPYYRFKLDSILPENTNKTIYLDGDMLIIKDIRELFAIDLQEQSAMAVCENKNTKKTFDRLKFTNTQTTSENSSDNALEFSGKYLNSGLLLIEVDNWKKNEITLKCIELMQNYHLNFPDQDALNIALNGFTELANSWNMCIGASIHGYHKLENIKEIMHDSMEAMKKIKNSPIFNIIHYNNLKPWSSLGYRLAGDKVDITYSAFINLWWETAKDVPYFKDDLLAIKQSHSYIKATEKEKKLLDLSQKASAFKVYITVRNLNQKLQPTIRKVEKPIKQLRNKIRGKLAQ